VTVEAESAAGHGPVTCLGIETIYLFIEVSEGFFQKFAVPGVLRLFELLDYALAGEPEVFLFATAGRCLRSEFDAGLAGGLGGFGLLSLDRLTFPAARHIPIIELPGGRWSVEAVG
jgi:hypothetical protein